MPVSPTERKFLLSQVSSLAQQQLNQLWQQAEKLSDTEFFALVVSTFPAVVDPFVEMAAQLSATWFELSLPTSPYVAVTAPPLPEERLIGSARWALGVGGKDGSELLSGAAQRAVFDGARDTTLLNVQKTDSKWARHASANACAFCRLLSTRGSAYNSEKSAATDVHDHCHCIPIEVRDGQTYEPPPYAERWQQEYLKARSNSGSGDPHQILAAWRQLEGANAR